MKFAKPFVVVTFVTLCCLSFSGCQWQNTDVTLLNHTSFEAEESSWKPKLLHLIKRHSPHIITTQNNNERAILSITDAFTQYAIIGDKCPESENVSTFAPIFYNENLYALMAKSQFILTDSTVNNRTAEDTSLCNALVTWVTLRNNNTGYMLYVFNVNIPCSISAQRIKPMFATLEKHIKILAKNTPAVVTSNIKSANIIQSQTSPLQFTETRTTSPRYYVENGQRYKTHKYDLTSILTNSHFSPITFIAYTTLDRKDRLEQTHNVFIELNISIKNESSQ
jgi:hypothetical protein